MLAEPAPANHYQSEHVQWMLRGHERLTGRPLLTVTDPEEAARALFEAPFFVASHVCGEDPILNYGNRVALGLFEMTWDEFTRTPSRFTAEAPERSERDHLLATVAAQGYIDDYSGIRIAKSGRRFRIEQATVWNLLDEVTGEATGQAATFSSWEYL
jgi:hypothetical protein